MRPALSPRWTAERTIALLFGTVYLVLAVVGIVGNIAALNAAHNVVHLLAAAMWLAGAASGAGAPAHLGAGAWLIGAGLLGLAGVIQLTSGAHVLDDVLHLVNGLGAVSLGAWSLKGARTTLAGPR